MSEDLLNGINVAEYRVKTAVDLKEDDKNTTGADYYYATYEIKMLGRWRYVDTIGACDWNNNTDEPIQRIKDEMKAKWNIEWKN